MKIISFDTETFEGERHMTIFFKLRNSDYNRLVKMKFFDIYQMCEEYCWMSYGNYNYLLFRQNDELRLSGDVYNHTDKCFITPEF